MYAELIAVWREGPMDEAVPQSTAKAIDLPAGTDADLGVTLVDGRGKPVVLDLAGTDKLELVVRLASSGVALITKNATAVTGDGAGRYKFSLLRIDTSDFAGRMIFEAYATKAAVKRRVIDPGYLYLGLGQAL